MGTVMKIGVKIMPRLEVLDTQGRAVEKTLQQHGRKVDAARVGKYVELQIGEANEASALQRAREIAEFTLYNPLIETFELEVVSSK
jgi:phosphoribosylformylglycinamidine synthase subunit PurS